MKKYLYFILSFITINAFASWDSSVIIGEWENYDHNQNYKKLTINNDYSGTLFSIREKDKEYTYSFTKKDLQIVDGLAILSLNEGYKLVFSAWGKSLGTDVNRILGQFYYYRIIEGNIELVNSMPVTFDPVTANSKIINNETIENR